MFNDKIKGLLVGLLAGSMLTGGLVFARSGNQWIEASYDNIKLYVNGSKVDTSSNEPFIYDGSTYLPVRAVAEALGQNVDWDGNTKSVYIGSIQQPSLLLKDADNIADFYQFENAFASDLTDNYGNSYAFAIGGTGNFLGTGSATFKTILNNKYSRFKTTLYVSQNHIIDRPISLLIEGDGKILYSSPVFTKTTKPVDVDISLANCNTFSIIVNSEYSQSYNYNEQAIYMGNAEFYN